MTNPKSQTIWDFLFVETHIKVSKPRCFLWQNAHLDADVKRNILSHMSRTSWRFPGNATKMLSLCLVVSSILRLWTLNLKHMGRNEQTKCHFPRASLTLIWGHFFPQKNPPFFSKSNSSQTGKVEFNVWTIFRKKHKYTYPLPSTLFGYKTFEASRLGLSKIPQTWNLQLVLFSS